MLRDLLHRRFPSWLIRPLLRTFLRGIRTFLEGIDVIGVVLRVALVLLVLFVLPSVLWALVSQYRPELSKVGLGADERAAVVPVAAAISGALIAFAWTWLLKRRDERREMHAVARLVDVELAEAAALLDPRLGGPGKRVWDPPDLLRPPLPRRDESESVERLGGLAAWQALRRRELLTATAWQDHKLLLARQLKYHEWDRVRRAYASIQHVKENAVEPAETLDEIHRTRWLLRGIDRARGVCERWIGDDAMDPYYWVEGRLDEAVGEADDGPHAVGLSDLVDELRSAVALGRLSASSAESLGGYLLLRSAGAVTHLREDEYKSREADVRGFGFVLDPKREPREHLAEESSRCHDSPA